MQYIKIPTEHTNKTRKTEQHAHSQSIQQISILPYAGNIRGNNKLVFYHILEILEGTRKKYGQRSKYTHHKMY